MTPKSASRKKINLALQGGGAHGAFTWGVLDKLLEDDRIDIEAISGTSAGAMNACVLAYGLESASEGASKNENARRLLTEFWQKVSDAGLLFNPVKRLPWDMYMQNQLLDSFAYTLFDTLTRVVSPYQFNPFDINPLSDVLHSVVDFDVVSSCDKVKLFIATTHVQSGKIRVFETKDITHDVVMASACLPFLFQAVTINDEEYWDGGYTGNPPLYPLFYKTQSRDILIVHVNPITRDDSPKQSADIMNRINEISFNSSLISEMRAISFVKKLIEKDMLKDEYKDDFKNVLLHSVRADEALKDYSVRSKFESSWSFLTDLRDRGRRAMAVWLDTHFDALGKKDTVDIKAEFLYSLNNMFDD